MSFMPFATYKDSGAPWLGAVPGHWDVERLRFRAKLNPGSSNELQAEDLVSFLPMESIGDDI
jgi:type I restriction enzyme S subunit